MKPTFFSGLLPLSLLMVAKVDVSSALEKQRGLLRRKEERSIDASDDATTTRDLQQGARPCVLQSQTRQDGEWIRGPVDTCKCKDGTWQKCIRNNDLHCWNPAMTEWWSTNDTWRGCSGGRCGSRIHPVLNRPTGFWQDCRDAYWIRLKDENNKCLSYDQVGNVVVISCFDSPREWEFHKEDLTDDHGQIRARGTERCLTYNNYDPDRFLHLRDCHPSHANQKWTWNTNRDFKFRGYLPFTRNMCVDFYSHVDKGHVRECSPVHDGNQQWKVGGGFLDQPGS